MLAVPLEIPRQHLTFQRIMDSLVAPLDFISFEVDAHVGQASHGTHAQCREAANHPQSRQSTTGQRHPGGKSAHDDQEFLP